MFVALSISIAKALNLFPQTLEGLTKIIYSMASQALNM